MLGSSGLLRSLSSTGFEALASLSLALFSGYLISLGLYRLYLSPLSKFPGPKITAVTGWYESYCDLIKDGGGQFTKQIHSWHETYGPIVRINPWEIHVNDPSYYENIYSASLPFDKMKSYENRFNAPLASFSTSEYDLHRKRRGALNPYFSRQKVAEYMPKIRERAHKLLQRLQREFADKRRVLVLNDVFACFTTDTVIDYAFDFSMDLIDEPKFCAKFTSAVHDLQISMHYGEAFPWTVPLIDSLPESIVTFLFPPTKSIFEFRKELRALIQYARSRHAAGEKPRRIVFDKLLQSDLPQEELSMARLEQEALSIVAAGLDSTKTVACNFTYRVLARPDVLSKLKAELAEAIPNPRELPSWTELEGLPYFGACLQEGS
ncbi:MAG: hypothetical protein M1821_002541 [Bathelium mastoideum]|nr:MAG: hypothetical protein M1821_002541 [Bathelium mastoideum]